MALDYAPPPPFAQLGGEDGSTRQRLLLTALRLFTNQGYANTSIRAIAKAARVNVASVSYYFGDKAALYAALLSEPCGSIDALIPSFTHPGQTLRESLHSYYANVLAALHRGEAARQLMHLHIRETLAPSGHWERELDKDVRRPHHAMVGLLCHHMNVKEPDDAMHRLVLTISGLGFQLWSHQEVIDTVQPQLLSSAEAVDIWVDRLTDYALALIEVEQRHYSTAPPAPHDAQTPSAPPSARHRKSLPST